MTPKSLLRHKEAVSDLHDFAKGGFQTVIPETADLEPKKIKRVIVCSGKVYYDLRTARGDREDTAILRLEQLYPFPHKAFAAELKKYPHATDVVWCQDEPQNQGAWFQIQHNLLENLDENQKLSYAGRPASASPAVGYYAMHNEQQKALIQAAFGRSRGLVLGK